MRPVKVLVMFVRLARLTNPLSTVWGASKRSTSFNSIVLSVRLRIVKAGRDMVSIDEEKKQWARARVVKAFHGLFGDVVGVRLKFEVSAGARL